MKKLYRTIFNLIFYSLPIKYAKQDDNSHDWTAKKMEDTNEDFILRHCHYANIKGIGPVGHLSIERTDGKEIVKNWEFFQQIKNNCFGREGQMVEVFPKESELVNYANIRHFWVLPKDYIIPFTTNVKQAKQ